MIVELCMTDLLALVNGTQVAVKDVIVRPTEADASSVVGEEWPSRTVEDRRQKNASRRNARAAVTKTGQRWMRAIYPHGRCAEACTNTWQKGDLMLYDYDTRRSLCPTHGKAEFPNLPIPEELR